MIVVSDDEDEIEEVKRNERRGVKQIPRRSKSGTELQGNKSSDVDDVCVVGEVVGFNKRFPKGCRIAPPRAQEPVLHLSTIRRRRCPENNSFTNYCTIRRGVNTLPSFRGIHPNVLRRKLYQKNEVVRLDERSKYLTYVQYMWGAGMIVAAANVLRNAIQNLCTQSFRSFQSFEAYQKDQTAQSSARNVNEESRRKDQHAVLDVECIDLTIDSDNEIAEIPKDSTPSKSHQGRDGGGGDDGDGDDDDVEEVCQDYDDNEADEDDNVDSHDDDIIDLEPEPETTPSKKHTSSNLKELDVECISSSSEHSEEPLGADDSGDLCITVEDEISSTSANGVQHTGKSKAKSDLEEQMLQQMIIHDDSENIIDVERAIPDDQEADDGSSNDKNYDDLEESLPEITHDMQVLVHKAFRCTSGKVLVEGFGLTIHTKDLHTLKGTNWLNDQVINFYMSLLMERGKLSSYPSVYCFNTFFYVKLLTSGHSSLARWTRTVDLFSYDLLIIPLHLKVHWCLACVNFIEKRIEYYDSMGAKNDECGKALLRYLEEENLDKRNEIFNTSGWEILNMEDIPEQLNGSDCGVFLCTYAEYICRLAKLTFTQRDMPYFRVKMAYEILTKKLLL